MLVCFDRGHAYLVLVATTGFYLFFSFPLLLLFRFFYCHLMCLSLLGFQLCYLEWFSFYFFIYHCRQPLQRRTLDLVSRMPHWKTGGFSLGSCIWFVERMNFPVRFGVVGLFNLVTMVSTHWIFARPLEEIWIL